MEVDDYVEGVQQKCAEVDAGENEVDPPSTETLSALSAFSMLASMSFTADEDGYFYDRDQIRYTRTGEEGQFVYNRVTSILKESNLSPTLSEGVSTPINGIMVDRALQHGFPP